MRQLSHLGWATCSWLPPGNWLMWTTNPCLGPWMPQRAHIHCAQQSRCSAQSVEGHREGTPTKLWLFPTTCTMSPQASASSLPGSSCPRRPGAFLRIPGSWLPFYPDSLLLYSLSPAQRNTLIPRTQGAVST